MSDEYAIGLRGRLEQSYDWFPGMDVETRDEQTTLRGTVVDQAALHGLLATVRDLNLELLYVVRTERKDREAFLVCCCHVGRCPLQP
ncbi:MAG: hypothetical protein JXA57_10265 [Armatimonadetes bacterium]|nr:hypothetical protein [Armatimonadota bacterium]